LNMPFQAKLGVQNVPDNPLLIYYLGNPTRGKPKVLGTS
jgi:hypothetical protein